MRNRVFQCLRSYDDGLFHLYYAIDAGLINRLRARLPIAYQHDFLPSLAGLGLPRVGKHGAATEQILKKLRKGQHPCYSDRAEGMARLREKMGDVQIYG